MMTRTPGANTKMKADKLAKHSPRGRLDDDPEGECGAEVRAMAVHNNTAEAEEEGTHHPEAHGDPIGSDSDNRQYFACVGDLRVYRWEKPKANAFAQPAWGTVCVGLKETMAFADSLKGGKRNSKDYLLWEYLTETHLPPHLAAVEREERAARTEALTAGKLKSLLDDVPPPKRVYDRRTAPGNKLEPVSYTHLTLPTIYPV